MSFFDEADEPQPRQETRRARTAGPPRARSGRPPGGSGPPPRTPQQQQIHNRRLIAVGVVVVLVILIAVLLSGSGGDSGAVKSYNTSVYRLVDTSTTNAYGVLEDLAGGELTSIGQKLTDAEQAALQNVAAAERLQAPSELASAQSALVQMMKLRQQALLIIATYTPEAATKRTSGDAVRQIARGTGLLYGSDAVYKTLVTPALAEALNGAGLTAGTNSGPLYAGQVIPDLGWLNDTWIADKIGATLSTKQANVNNDQPNLIHGDALVSTTVDGQTLQPGITNMVPAADALNWALGVSDGGQTNELDVGCSIQIADQSDAGTGTMQEIAAGGTGTCNVKLPSTPEAGPYTVTATVDKVPGETNIKNNTASYTVKFTG